MSQVLFEAVCSASASVRVAFDDTGGLRCARMVWYDMVRYGGGGKVEGSSISPGSNYVASGTTVATSTYVINIATFLSAFSSELSD